MSKEIDQKVVEMRFDNKHFEQNVSTTMSSIKKLEESLKFKGAEKGFNNLDKSARNVDMTHLGKGLETVQAKFSALQVIGVTALANITNSAINAGKRIASALTIDPIKTGFQEYETQINATQTILANTASKGSTIEDVNRALAELNTYADKTIYNFTEMTRNIGTFTAAGIDLETSVNSIQGIANLAAVSGSTSQQASTAMYQLSQALAAGTVKLMDWNSVVNAGMGGEMFQNALKETSKELGTGAEAAIKASGSFRESLKDGWLTAEVLTATLKKFTTSGANEYVAKYTGLSTEAVEAALKEAEARYGEADAIEKASEALAKKSGKNKDEIKSALQFAKNAEDAATKVKTFSQLWDVMKESAQSGWAQTWKLIVGDFEQAKNLLTPLADFLTGIIGKFNDARNKLLEGALGKTFTKLSEQIRTIVDPVKDVTKSVSGVVDTLKDYNALADEIIAGKWGNAPTRFQDLAAAGYDWAHAQNLVNEKLGNSYRYTTEYAEAQKSATNADKSATDAKTELSKADAKSLEMLCALSDEELRNQGLTKEQIEALRQLQKEADKLGLSVGDFLSQIDELDGRTILINSFKNIGQSLVKLFKSIGQAYRDVFPPMTSDQLYNIIAAFHKFSMNMKMSDDTAKKIRDTFKGLFAILDIVLTIVGGPIKIAFKILGEILGAAGVGILDVTAFIGNAIYKFNEWLDSVLDFTKIFEWMLPYLKEGVKAVKEWFISLKNSETVKNFIKELSSAFKSGAKAVKEWFAGFKDSETLQKLVKIFKHLAETIKSFISGTDLSGAGSDIVSGLINGLKSGVSKVVSTIGNIAKSIIDTICDMLGIKSPSRIMIAIGGFIIAGLIKGLVTGETNLLTNLKELGSSIITFFENMLGDIGISLKNFELPQINFDTILAAGGIVGLVIAAKKVLNVFEMFGKAAEGFGKACSGAGDLMSALADKISPKKSKFEEVADSVLKMSISVGILAASVYALAQLETTKLWSAVGAVAALSGVVMLLAVAAKLVGGADGSLGKLALTLFGISLAVGTMAVAMKKLEFLTEDNIGPIKEGLLLVGGIIAAFMLISKIPVDTKGMLGTLVGVSVAMLIMTKVIKTMGEMDIATIKQGYQCIVAFALIIGALMLINKIPGGSMISLGSMFMGFGLVLLSMISVIKMTGTMDVNEIKQGYQCIAAFALIIGGLMLINKIPGGGTGKLVGMFFGVSMALLSMSACIKILGTMDPAKLQQGVDAIKTFAIIIGALMLISKIPGNTKGLTGTLIALSVAIAALAGVTVVLGLVSEETLRKGLSVVGTIGIMIATILGVSKLAEKSAGSIWAVTASIAVIAGAIWLLSGINGTELAGATIAIGSLMAIFAIVLATSSKAKGALGSIIAITAAIGVIAGSLYVLAQLPVKNALASAGALAILMLSLTGVMAIISNLKNVEKAQWNLLIMTGAIAVLSACLYLLALLPIQNALASAGALAVLMLSLVGVMAIISNLKHVKKANTTLLAMTAAIAVMAGALYLLAMLPVQNALASAGALAILMLSLSASMLILSNMSGSAVAGAASLLIIAAALAVLTPCLIALGSLSLAQVGTGLLALAGALTVIGLAGYLLTGASVGLLALGGAVALIGAGCLMAGQGVLAFATALNMFLMTAMMCVGQGPVITDGITAIITGICGAIVNSASTITMAIASVILAITQALIVSVPAILNCLNVMITSGLQFLVSVVPKFVTAGMQIIKGILRGIADNIGGIVKAAIDIVVNFINAVSSKIGAVIDAGIKLMISFINGLANGIRNNTGSMISAIDNLMDAVIGAVKKYFSHFAGKGKELIGKMIDGVKSKFSSFKGAAKDMMEGFIKGVKEKFGSIKKAAVNAIKGAVDGVKSFLGIKSPSRVFMKIGRYTDEGFAMGLKKYAKLGVNAATDMGAGALDALKDVLGVNSPATEGINIGAFLTEGFAIGIEKLGSIVKDAGTNVGSISVKGIAEGIKKDMSAEEQAEKKATNITKAFKKKFDELDTAGKTADLNLELGVITDDEHYEQQLKLQSDRIANAWAEYQQKVDTFGEDSEHAKTAYNTYLQELTDLKKLETDRSEKILDDRQKQLDDQDELLDRQEAALDRKEEIANLEYEIWSKTNENTATEGEKAAANINMLTGQYNISLQRLNDAQSKYQQYLNDANRTAEEIDEARIAVLNAQSAFIDAQNNLSTAQEDEAKRQKQALAEYNKYLREYKAVLLDMGYTNEEIEASARKSSGYDPNSTIDTAPATNAGSAFVSSFSETLQNGDSEGLTTAVQTMVSTCADTLKEQKPAWIDAGHHLVEGFAQGIQEYVDRAVDAAIAMAKAAITAAKRELDINSPSRVFAQMGRFVDEGFAQGITKYARVAENATAGLGESIVNSIGGPISRIAEIANSGMDIKPTVRPVLDISSVRNSSSQIDRMFGQRSLALASINASIARTDMDNLSSIASRMESINNDRNAELVGAISNLRGDFGKLVDAIGGMHIRMDSGTVVGELIGKIDSNLGQIANHKGRGN